VTYPTFTFRDWGKEWNLSWRPVFGSRFETWKTQTRNRPVICFRTAIGCGLLWTFLFHKRRAVFWLAERTVRFSSATVLQGGNYLFSRTYGPFLLALHITLLYLSKLKSACSWLTSLGNLSIIQWSWSQRNAGIQSALGGRSIQGHWLWYACCNFSDMHAHVFACLCMWPHRVTGGVTEFRATTAHSKATLVACV
jgi:hypothetical protein